MALMVTWWHARIKTGAFALSLQTHAPPTVLRRGCSRSVRISDAMSCQESWLLAFILVWPFVGFRLLWPLLASRSVYQRCPFRHERSSPKVELAPSPHNRRNVALPQTDINDVVPTKGAVVLVPFATRIGEQLLLKLIQKNGSPVPFGSIAN